jgi:hypothetical protein
LRGTRKANDAFFIKKTEKLVKPPCFLKQGCVKKAEAAGWVSPAAELLLTILILLILVILLLRSPQQTWRRGGVAARNLTRIK